MYVFFFLLNVRGGRGAGGRVVVKVFNSSPEILIEELTGYGMHVQCHMVVGHVAVLSVTFEFTF